MYSGWKRGLNTLADGRDGNYAGQTSEHRWAAVAMFIQLYENNGHVDKSVMRGHAVNSFCRD